MLAGSFREGGNVPPIRARAQDTVVVGITWVDEEQQVFVRGDSDIHTAADLRGLLTALQLGGVPRDSVEFVDKAFAQKDFLLGEGFIDKDFDVAGWIDPAPLQQAWAIKDEIVLD